MGGGYLSRMLGAFILLCNVVNWASQIYMLRVWQYVVFIIKLILSYLPVYLTDSLLSSPLMPSLPGERT